MTASETEIMRQFRRYLVHEGEMLFFNAGAAKAHPASFHDAIASLIRAGFLIQERHGNAFSLTRSGYEASVQACTVR